MRNFKNTLSIAAITALISTTALAGTGDDANLVQEGTGLVAGISQSNPSDAEKDKNVINAYQGGQNHELYLKQNGSRNITNTSQNGTGSYIDSAVEGNGNFVQIAQGLKGGNLVNDAVATANINGNNNYVSVDQKKGKQMTSYNMIMGDKNRIVVNQDGSKNNPRAHRVYSDMMIKGNRNDIEVNQIHTNQAAGWVDGNDNNLKITQRNTADYNWFNMADAEIKGDYNDVNITQIATMMTAGVNIVGDGNQANILQTGGKKFKTNTSKAYITIRGNKNRGDITQSQGARNYADMTLVGEGNTSTINQTGNDNVSGVAVKGHGNTNWEDTVGSDNMALITQHGDVNTAGIVQRGNGNMAEIIQTTHKNQAYITQKGNNFNASIIQNKGSGNYASIVQGK